MDVLSYASAPVMSATLAARALTAFILAVASPVIAVALADASPVIAAIRLVTSVLILVPLIAMASISLDSVVDKCVCPIASFKSVSRSLTFLLVVAEVPLVALYGLGTLAGERKRTQ